MNAPNATNNHEVSLTGIVNENTSLFDKVRDLSREGWIGADRVFLPRRSPSRRSEPWDGSERRNLRPHTIEEVANALNLLPSDIDMLVSKKAIPGAFREGTGPVKFDAVEFREWFADLLEGRSCLPR